MSEVIDLKPVTVTKRYEWDMGHRLPNHRGKCRRLHGHRYVAEIDFTGPIQDDGPAAGMVIDFDDIKQHLQATIGDQWDHMTMLYVSDPILLTLETHVELMPAEGWGLVIVEYMPTAENIAKHLMLELRERGLPVSRVRVYETPSGWAEVKL